jgi:4-hydroxybenzoate polyprenyltransferase
MTLTERLIQYFLLARLHRPIGILLLLWPTLWGLWIASDGNPGVTNVIVFVLGTVLMRSAGCAINDYADRDFDGQVQRTKDRPLAARRISTDEAVMVAATLAFIAFLLVYFFLNKLSLYLSFAALAIAATYPLFKRFFLLPQAYLGIAFGFGIPMAFAAETDGIPAIAWWLLAANICWTIAYDTEYAMVDRNDDVRIGIKTTALLFGRFDVLAVMLCYAAMLGIMAIIGFQLQLGWIYVAGLVVAAAIAGEHYRMIRDRSREGCFKAFMHNNWLGAAIFAGILMDYALQT